MVFLWRIRVTSLEYHPTHDQLLLTASSDGQVLLHDIGSVSYAGVADSDSSEVESDEGEDREPRYVASMGDKGGWRCFNLVVCPIMKATAG